MDSKLIAVHHKFQTDLPFFAANAPLLVKDKNGSMIPFRLNRAQRYLHARLEEQLRKTGRVRALVLKGRQQGCSTYISARFFHKATREKGRSVFILSHEGKTTEKLFRMVNRFYENLPEPLRPEIGASNRNQLVFPSLESDYSVGTAGNANVGRGGTVQLFHGSEAAFWENTNEIQTGILQSVGDVPNTEIILESTANGPKDLFYQKCIDALKGLGEYILVFIPWFWQDEYEKDDADFVPTNEELKYAEGYLSEYTPAVVKRKLAWRRQKILDFKSEWLFKQEYPSNPSEAFQTSGAGLVKPEAIIAARVAKIVDDYAPLIVGVDPAGENGDRKTIVWRRGRVLEKYVAHKQMAPMELVGVLAKVLTEDRPDMMFVDKAYGDVIVDRLREMGFKNVIAVSFKETPLRPDLYLNKRAEMLCLAAEWVNGGGVSIPDDETLHADLAVTPEAKLTSNGLKYIILKAQIKALLGQSPDIFDAFALTFAYPVKRKYDIQYETARVNTVRADSPLRSLHRIRKRR